MNNLGIQHHNMVEELKQIDLHKNEFKEQIKGLMQKLLTEEVRVKV